MASSKQGTDITDQQSVLFDFFRVFATFAVVLQHATGDPNLAPEKVSLLGRAVIPFFLIVSGYMTAMTVRPNAPLAAQIARRYVKYYHVVIVAVVFGYLSNLYLVEVGSVMTERIKFEAADSVWIILREIFDAFTYSGEYWRLTTHSQGVFGNEAYWTMDYIIAYVAMTLILYLSSGVSRWLWLAAAALIAGPTVLLLAPLWFAGVLTYEVHRRMEAGRIRRLSRAAAWAFIVAGAALVLVAELTALGETAYEASKSLFSYDIREHLGMSKRYPWQWIVTLGLFFIVLGARYVLSERPAPRATKAMRTVSAYTLPVYLLHFNAIYVAQTLIPNYDPTTYFGGFFPMFFLAFSITLVLSWVAIHWLEPPNNALVKRLMNKGTSQ